jgi:protein ImuB
LAADRLEYRQQEMFVDPRARRDAPRELAALVDRLSNRLGAGAVLRPWLLAGAQPEFACQYRPMALGRGQESGVRGRRRGGTGVSPVSERTRQHGQDANATAGDRPLYLRPRPLRLPVMSIAPEGPPVQFRLGRREHRIVRVWGPERIETGWWRAGGARRDYYQVETGGGERFWLFRELTSGAWFLHGEFA